jgi:hypothetical protein
MLDLSQYVDVEDVKNQQKLGDKPPLIPDGWYNLVLCKYNKVDKNEEEKSVLWLTFKVIDGPEENSQFSFNLNIRNRNKQTVAWAMKDINSLKGALGVSPAEWILDNMMNIPFRGKVGVDSEGTVHEKNKIFEYEMHPDNLNA